MEFPPEWYNIVDQLAQHRGAIMILGAPDTGKSTLSKFLTMSFARLGFKVCLVDGDVGQSMVGPPTTVSLGFPVCPEEIKLSSMCFLGAVSPEGHLGSVINAFREIIRKTVKYDLKVVNTTGLIHGRIGKELKLQKISLINPRHIIALQRKNEIEDLLGLCQEQFDAKIHRLGVSSSVKRKSTKTRGDFREEKFREYFRGAKEYKFPKEIIRGEHFQIIQEEVKGLLVGLNADDCETLAVGMINYVSQKEVYILTPLESTRKVKEIKPGYIRLNPFGKELSIVRNCYKESPFL